jgi:PKD repeat protein
VVDGTTVATVASATCGVTCTSAPVDLPEGGHNFFVRARDAGGNTSDGETRQFTVAVAPVPSFTIAPNPVLVNGVATFDASASSDERGSITRYEWDFNGDGVFETDAAGAPRTTHSYPAAGQPLVSLRVTDASGNTATASQTIRVSTNSTTTTQFGVSINKGAQYTNDVNVKLKVVFPTLTSSILVSNDGGFDAPQQFIPIGEINWKLDSSGPERLPKTVYVRFLPSLTAGLTFTDDIILDETPPKVDAASVTPPAGAASVSALRKWKIKVKARDSNSGVGFVQVTANKKKPGKLIKYKTKLTVKLGARPKFLRARDRAGNFSAWKKLR